MFADPRTGKDRRTKAPKAVARQEDKRTQRDRRVYPQSRQSKSWWLMRQYVSAEIFVGGNGHQ